jgi:hypothetical protein
VHNGISSKNGGSVWNGYGSGFRKREELQREIAEGAAFYASIMDNAGTMVCFKMRMVAGAAKEE